VRVVAQAGGAEFSRKSESPSEKLWNFSWNLELMANPRDLTGLPRV